MVQEGLLPDLIFQPVHNLSCITFQRKEQELCQNVTLIIAKSASDLNDISQTKYFHVAAGFNHLS